MLVVILVASSVSGAPSINADVINPDDPAAERTLACGGKIHFFQYWKLISSLLDRCDIYLHVRYFKNQMFNVQFFIVLIWISNLMRRFLKLCSCFLAQLRVRRGLSARETSRALFCITVPWHKPFALARLESEHLTATMTVKPKNFDTLWKRTIQQQWKDKRKASFRLLDEKHTCSLGIHSLNWLDSCCIFFHSKIY